jgi:HK97 family phage portal protein
MGILQNIKGLFREKAAGVLDRASFGLVERMFGPQWSDRTYLEQYAKSLYVYACVSRIAEKYGSIEFKLTRIINSKGDIEEIKNHEILDLLYRANPFFTKAEFLETDLINRKLSGDSYILKVRNNSRQVAELWPIRPDLVTVWTDPDKYINYYEVFGADGKMMKIQPEDMIHIKYPSPLNQFNGLSPLTPAKNRIDTEFYATEHQKNFFVNNARPDAVLESDATLTKAQRDELRDSWNKQHKGNGKNSKMGFLWGGLKYHQISLSQHEMDFIESMKFTRDDIMLAFKINKSVMGITEDVNRANAEAGMAGFLSETIIPEVRRYVDKINEELIGPDFGEEYTLTFVDPVPADRVQKLAEYTAGVDKWITRNEIRAEMNLEPKEGGDVLYGALALVELGAPKPEPVAPVPAPAPDNSKNLHGRRALRLKLLLREAMHEQIKELKKSVKKTISKSKEVKDNSLFKDAVKRQQYYDYRMKDIDRKSTKIQSLALSLSGKQAVEFAAKFEKENPTTKTGIKKIFGLKEQTKKFSKAIMPVMFSIFDEAGNDALDLVGEKSLDVKEKEANPEIMALLKIRADFFADSVNNTTLDDLTRTLSEGINAGESIPELKNRIKAVYDQFETYRATLIARTETNAVVNEAHLNAYEESKVVKGKEYICTLDARVRDSHLMLDGEQKRINEPFSNGLMYPGQAGGPADEVCNCRCTIAPLTRMQ